MLPNHCTVGARCFDWLNTEDTCCCNAQILQSKINIDILYIEIQSIIQEYNHKIPSKQTDIRAPPPGNDKWVIALYVDMNVWLSQYGNASPDIEFGQLITDKN